MKKLYVSNKDESVRMFKSDFLEFFTKVHWSIPAILYVPLISFFIYKSFTFPAVGWLNGIGLFAFGIIIWSITEYIIHRFVFHFTPKGDFQEWVHFTFHGVHHDYPNDSNRLVMPPILSIPLAFFFYYSFEALLGSQLIAPFFSGFVLGYLFYDMLHYAIHHANFKGRLWNELKTHHLKHHFKDPDAGYGVSSPIWDHVVGTTFKSKKEN